MSGTQEYTPEMMAQVRTLLDGEILAAEIEHGLWKAQKLSEVVGKEIKTCLKCHRLLIPRRLWYLLGTEEEGRPYYCARTGDPLDLQLCNYHAIDANKARLRKEMADNKMSAEKRAMLVQLAKGIMPR